MRLDACKYNHCYKIIDIGIQDVIAKERLASLGLVSGAAIMALHTSAKKATISVQVQQTIIALRSHEARYIEVEPLEA